MPPRLQLTFDDGPDERSTPTILSALARHGARARFFMIGERAAASQRLARAVIAAGHDVQLHCHRHVRHSLLSEKQIERDARAGLSALRAVGGAPTLWRTPWGVRTADTRTVADRLDLRLVAWDHDSHDWRGDSAEEMLAAIEPRLGEGGVVLMHDGLGPGSRRSSSVNTAELLSGLLAFAERAGLAVALAPAAQAAAGSPSRQRAAAL